MSMYDGSGQPPMEGQPPAAYTPYAGLYLRQKVTMVTNKYWISMMDSNAVEGQVVAFAEQKKMKLREEVTFFSDETKSTPLFGFKSRQVIDMAATTDVFDMNGQPIGEFRKDAMKSLLNSTWHLAGPGFTAVGRERSKGVAAARRFAGFLPVVGDVMDMVPWQFHFDFFDPAGTLVMSDERVMGMRDRYKIWLPPSVHGAPMDWRFASAVAVALDAFQGR